VAFDPGGSIFGYSVIVAVTDLLLLDEFYFYADGRDKDYKQWYQITGLCAMVVYALYCIRLYGAYKIRIYRTLSYADNIRLKWLKQFFIILILIIVLRALFTLLLPEMGDWGVKWWYYFLFGLLSYYLSFSGYTNSLLLNNWRQQPAPSSVDLDEAKSSRVTLPEEKVDQLLERVKDLLLKEKYYKDPTLSLPQLAKEAQTNPSILSKVINEGTGMNFNDFINRYRVEAVKKAFEQGEHQRKTLEGIAWEAGFNSKSTFLRAFKKHTAMTPTQYKNSL
jgi:AraC-like DNA-binding protein